ncbi:protein MMS22-like [Hetaerina americana]|uniref:protein MMS22-like n=1 Tax=Hetaerina americana TaxID=62018 RepID=UPI003A7F2E33
MRQRRRQREEGVHAVEKLGPCQQDDWHDWMLLRGQQFLQLMLIASLGSTLVVSLPYRSKYCTNDLCPLHYNGLVPCPSNECGYCICYDSLAQFMPCPVGSGFNSTTYTCQPDSKCMPTTVMTTTPNTAIITIHTPLGCVPLPPPLICPRSFLPSGEKDFIQGNVESKDSGFQRDVLLFGRVFDQGSAIQHAKLLFQMARKEFKTLEMSFHSTSDGTGSTNGDMTEEECQQTRKHICGLFDYIRVFLSSVPLEKKSLMSELKGSVMPLMSSFHKCLPKLSSLPPIHHQHFFKKGSRGFYHMFHLNLDVRWYYISILLIVKNYADMFSESNESGMGFFIESRKVRETKQLECQIHSLLIELTSVALARYEANSNDLSKETPFTCACVMEMWLLLQLLCDSLEESGDGKSFWAQFNSLLDRVQPISSAQGSIEHASNESSGKEVFRCSEPVSFSLWMLLHLSQLYGYSDQGLFLGRKSKRVKSNFGHLEKILSGAISLASQSSSESKVELQMRQYIFMTSELCLGRWWEPLRGEPVMIFWEYFHRRLNASLMIPGSSPAALQMMSKSAIGMLEQIRKSLSQGNSHDCNFDSFFLFMKFLGIYLMRCRAEESSLEDNESGVFRQWQQIRGRIYSKLGPAKVKGLSQCGLYRFISLFLMLSITADVKEVGKKMLEMLGMLQSWDPSGRDFPKRELVWQAYICLICLHVENDTDIAQVSTPLMAEVQAACYELAKLSNSNSSSSSLDSWKIDTHNSEGFRKLLSLFTEGLNEIMELSPRMGLSEFSLIGPWLPQWLSACSLSAARRLMDTLLAVVDKLRKLRQSLVQQNDLSDLWGDCDDLDMFNVGEESNILKEQWNKMEAALTEHVLPSVRNHCLGANPPFQAADLAVSFTLSAFSGDGDNYVQLFSFFVASDLVNHRISRRYLCQIMPYKNFMSALSLKLTNYQDIIIQAWIRSSLLSIEESAVGELKELAGYVTKMTKVSQLLSSQISSSSSSPIQIQSLKQFLKAIGEKYESLSSVLERSTFRENCSLFFNKLDKTIGPPIRSPSSEDIVKSIYHCCGLMVLHCGNIIYTKGKPNCLLPTILTHLILPPQIYNPDANIHKYLLSAIKESIHLYLHGLSKLSPSSNPYIKRCLQDIIKVYIPRLYEKNPGVAFNSLKTHHHPLLGCFEPSDNENEILQSILLEIITTILKSSRGRQVHMHAAKAIGLIQQITQLGRRRGKDEGKDLVCPLAVTALPALFEFLINVSDDAQEWKMAFDATNSLIFALKETRSSSEFRNQRTSNCITSNNGCEENFAKVPKVDSVGENCGSCESSDQWSEVLSSVVKKVCQRHMAFSASVLFRLMQTFVRSNPGVVLVAYKHLVDEVKEVERRRGVGLDSFLRSSLQKLQTSLEAVKRNSKVK